MSVVNYPVTNNINPSSSAVLGLTAPTIHSNYKDLIDTYSDLMEIKDNQIAATIANHRKNKERVSSTVIGFAGGILQGALFTGVYGLAKAFPVLQKFKPAKWAVGKVDEWIQRSKTLHPEKSLRHNIAVGIEAKVLWAALTGAAIGFAADLYKTYSNTRISGKVSNTKQGAVNDGWLLAGLNSLSYSKFGKDAIKDSIKVNKDNTITVQFKGVNREYNITKSELKTASRAYLTKMDKNGKVIGYKKKYSKGDGDVLAFELAFQKYRRDIIDGNLPKDSIVPPYADSLAGASNQVYYLLTGKNISQIDLYKPVKSGDVKNMNVLNLYSKAYLNKFIDDFTLNQDNYSATCRFNIKEPLEVKDRHHQKIKLKPNEIYAIKKIGKRYATIVDSHKSRVPVDIPINDFKSTLASVYFVNKDDNSAERPLQVYSEYKNKYLYNRT